MTSPRPISPRKRVFDLVVTLLAAPLWLPVCAIAALALWVTEGRPVFYVSSRRTLMSRTERVIKFRTMVRGADKILNRETVPTTDTRFLNIPPEHPIYTPVGRFIERFALTELPQLLHVLTGHMSLVGNRPLPENVIRALRAEFPYAEDRFLARTGLTGPVQLVGRSEISDADRLGLEIDYCLVTFFGYRMSLDLLVLIYTVLIALHLRKPLSVHEVRTLMVDSMRRSRVSAVGPMSRRESIRFSAPFGVCALSIAETPYRIAGFSYQGMRLIGANPIDIGTCFAIRDPGASAGALLARVRWCRRREDGEFDLGLSLKPDYGSGDNLLRIMNSLARGDARTEMLAPARS